jgi:hypothetical protein
VNRITILSALLFVVFSSIANGQGLPFGALNGDALQTTFQVEGIGPSISSERSSETLTHGRLELFVPIAQSDTDSYAIQMRATRLTLDTDRATPNTTALIPKDMGSIAVGPFARKKLENGDVVAGDVQVGRSGIELGANTTATTVSANIFWGRKKDADDGQWIYLISYSNSRSSLNNIPVPGFAYAKSFKTETSQGVWAAGAPFFFTMLRGQPWSFSALLTPFTSFVEAGYSIAGPFALFTRFGWQPQGFKMSGGPSERVVYEEFRTVVGVKGPLARWAMASVGVAYADGRRVAWGESVLRSADNQVRLQDETSLFLSLNGRF